VTKIAIHGVTLDLPNDHWLPQVRSQLPDYGENIGRLAAAVESKYPGRGFIDIGANVGDTAAIVRSHSKSPLLCIEGSELFYKILTENVRRLQADIELECALVDSSSAERTGYLGLQPGTANFRSELQNGETQVFSDLNTILVRHPRFRTSKVLKIGTDGMDGRILEGALKWIAAAHPVLFWEHDLGRDIAAQGPGLDLFGQLADLGYKRALIFDNTGEFVQTISLENRQLLDELSDYLPGGRQLHGYCDICAFHEEDADLCARFRQIEVENRATRRKTGATAPGEPLFRALLQSQFEAHSAQVTSAVQETIRNLMIEAPRLELAAVRADAHLERYRVQAQIADLEARISAKDAEIKNLRSLMREMLRIDDLRGQVSALQNELNSSLALRAARSLHWILAPIRKLLVRGAGRGPA
jgi:FkbM family methyltransferase